MDLNFIVLLLMSGVRLGTPLALASIGETLSQKTGVLNLGIEGYMTIATIIAFAGAHYTNDPWLATLMAVGASMLLALLYGILSVSLGLSQIVAGLGIMLFAGGMSCLLNSIFFEYNPPASVAQFRILAIPVLSEIPILGPILFRQHILLYIAFILVIAAWFILERTKYGLMIKGVGESAAAADTMGTKVNLVKILCVLLCGAMSGIAGAHLVLGVTGSFMTGMVGGRGFIVLAAIVLGRWKPIPVFLATFLFGFLDALQFRMQVMQLFGIPWEFWLMLPYIAAIMALTFTSSKAEYIPKELCIPYVREEK